MKFLQTRIYSSDSQQLKDFITKESKERKDDTGINQLIRYT